MRLGEGKRHRTSADHFGVSSLAADCFVAIKDARPESLALDGQDRDFDYSLEKTLGGRELEDAVLGMYCKSSRP